MRKRRANLHPLSEDSVGDPSPLLTFESYPWPLKPAPPSFSASLLQLLDPAPGRAWPACEPGSAEAAASIANQGQCLLPMTCPVPGRVAACPTLPHRCWPRSQDSSCLNLLSGCAQPPEQICDCLSRASYYPKEASENKPKRWGELFPGSLGGKGVQGG